MNAEQEHIFDAFCAKKNILIHGHAGTGKSYLIQHQFRPFLQSRCLRYAITSTTGISSLLLMGTTLHSYLGIGLGSSSVSSLISKIQKKPKLVQRYQTLDCLIIDEISMLSSEILDKIHSLFQHFRKDFDAPFGGLQMVLLGDFYQLPVVNPKDKFVFESPQWPSYQFHCLSLTQSMRQTDPRWIECLHHVRLGELSKDDISYLQKRCCSPPPSMSIIPTVLYSTNQEVDEENERHLQDLTIHTPLHVYPATFTPPNDEVKKHFPNYLHTLKLAKGAQVMFTINNLEEGYANGSRGIILNFIGDHQYPEIELLNKKKIIVKPHEWKIEVDENTVYSAMQFPLKLAWCITIHKAQGMTLDYVKTNIGSNIFAYGQAYVALSRIRTPEGLFLDSFQASRIRANPRVKAFFTPT